MKELWSVIRGAAPLTALEVVSVALALILVPYLLRVLGPDEFGRYAFGVAAGGAFAILVDFGFNQLGPKEIARSAPSSPARADIVWQIQLAKLQLAGLSLPLLVAWLWYAGADWIYRPVLMAAPMSMASALMFPQWLLQGGQHYRTLAASQGIARALVCAATLLLVQHPTDTALAVLLQTSSGACAGLLAFAGNAAYRRSMRPIRLPWAASWRELERSLPLFLSNVAISVYTTCVPLVIGATAAPAVLGLYGLADRMRAAVQALLAPIGVAAYPQFSRWLREDRARGLAAARRMLAMQFALGLAAAAAIWLVAKPVILLLAGPAFIAAVPVAQILALCIVFTAINNTLGVQIMLSLNEHTAYSTVLSVSAALGLVLVWLLCHHWGAGGAAFAVVVTEAVVAALMWAWLRRRRIL